MSLAPLSLAASIHQGSEGTLSSMVPELNLAHATCVASDVCVSVLTEGQALAVFLHPRAKGAAVRGPVASACPLQLEPHGLSHHVEECEGWVSLSHITFAFLGWTSRTQFEETWATLLGVLVTQPLVMEQEESPPEVRLRVGLCVLWLALGQCGSVCTVSGGQRRAASSLLSVSPCS